MRIIYDCDPGVDDTYALIYLAAAAHAGVGVRRARDRALRVHWRRQHAAPASQDVPGVCGGG